jgi:hypothetical protein
MGVRFISLREDDLVVAIARNAERAEAADEPTDDVPPLDEPDGGAEDREIAELPGEEGTVE